jgi:hypothetical protein
MGTKLGSAALTLMQPFVDWVNATCPDLVVELGDRINVSRWSITGKIYTVVYVPLIGGARDVLHYRYRYESCVALQNREGLV